MRAHLTSRHSTYEVGFPGDSEIVWDDLRVPMENTRINPANSEPAFEQIGVTGLYSFAFDAANNDDDSLHFVAQLPHGYKEGSDLHPHIHWLPSTTNTGNVVWELDYVAMAIDGTMGAVQTLEVTVAADGTALKHQVDELGTIDGDGLGISSMLICRLTRLGDDAADTFTGIAYAMEFDFHYQMDMLGSRQEYIK